VKLHTKYARSRLSGFREEDFIRFSYEKLISLGVVAFFWPGGQHLNKLNRGPLGDMVIINTKYQSSRLCGFRAEDF